MPKNPLAFLNSLIFAGFSIATRTNGGQSCSVASLYGKARTSAPVPAKCCGVLQEQKRCIPAGRQGTSPAWNRNAPPGAAARRALYLQGAAHVSLAAHRSGGRRLHAHGPSKAARFWQRTGIGIGDGLQPLGFLQQPDNVYLPRHLGLDVPALAAADRIGCPPEQGLDLARLQARPHGKQQRDRTADVRGGH